MHEGELRIPMNRYDADAEIVNAVLRNLSDRSGCNIEDIIDDDDIYQELRDDLFELVDDVLFRYLGDLGL